MGMPSGPYIAWLGIVLVFVVVFCSLASSIDSLLAATSDLLVEDVYRKMFRPGASEASLRRASTRIIIALGHLGHGAAVDPLLEILNDEQQQTIVREFAAVALGLMGDARERDPLFAVDAWFNYLATTRATNEFIRLY